MAIEPGERISATELSEAAASGASEALRERAWGWLDTPIIGGIIVRPPQGLSASESPESTADTASGEE